MKKKIFLIIGIILIIGLLTLGYLYCFTELLGEKVLPVKVNTISISYIPSGDLSLESKTRQLEEIPLKGNELKEVKTLLKSVQEKGSKIKDFNGSYILNINKDSTLIFNEGSALVTRHKKKTSVTISNELSNKVVDIVEKNNNKLFTNIEFKEIVIKQDGAIIKINNETNLNLLKNNIRYIPITLNEEDIKNLDKYTTEVIVDSDTHIYLYKDNIGLIKDSKLPDISYVILDEDFSKIINTIYNVSIGK